jgi:hypothetical protein
LAHRQDRHCYKKGPSANDYVLFDPVLDIISTYQRYFRMEVIEKLPFLTRSVQINPLLFLLYYRKRVFNPNDFEDVVNKKRFGCVIDQNYYMNWTNEGLIIFWKTVKAGYVDINNKKLSTAWKSKRLQSFANKVGYSL